jgi:ATP-dependent DNA helicase RecG
MPSPIEKLLKFIRLEANRGFDNRAVVGGLDQFAPIWENEARQHNISPELIAKVSGYLHAYPAASISERDRMIR